VSRRTSPLILKPVDEEDWLTSCPIHFTPKKAGTFYRGSWADHKADMDILEKRKISFPLAGFEPQTTQPIAQLI